MAEPKKTKYKKNQARKKYRCVPAKYPKIGGLSSGWKTWDRFLSEYVGKDINIMEIGVYEGVASKWFLDNIMTNKDSHFYAIDTFEGSPEYQEKIDFKEVKKTFDSNVRHKKDQVTLMKMLSTEALVKLLNIKRDQPKFDIIYIDASHEARDVLSDAVLAWKLLNENGTLIFDDYGWNKMSPEYFTPKPAIDAFMDVYKPELDILAIKYQVLIRKKHKGDFEKPIVDTSQKII